MNSVIKPISVVLKEARQNKGISLDEAHKATKIHHNILRSLEEGATLGLSHIYVKSYIKIYAKYLGIKQQELDKYFHPVAASTKEKKPHLDFHSKTKEIKVKSLYKISGLANLRFKIQPFKKIAVVCIVLLMLVFLIGLFRKPTAKDKDIVILGKVAINDSTSIKEAEPAKIEEPEPKETKETVPVEATDALRLTIFAKEDTWMQVKQDEAAVFKGILRKATSETWQAKDSIELRIADAGTVDLELNGKTLSSLGRKGQSLESVFITKDGLVIKK